MKPIKRLSDIELTLTSMQNETLKNLSLHVWRYTRQASLNLTIQWQGNKSQKDLDANYLPGWNYLLDWNDPKRTYKSLTKQSRFSTTPTEKKDPFLLLAQPTTDKFYTVDVRRGSVMSNSVQSCRWLTGLRTNRTSAYNLHRRLSVSLHMRMCKLWHLFSERSDRF